MAHKWYALALIVAGCLAAWHAYRMDAHASYEDGSFLGEIFWGLGGAGTALAGALWLVVICFEKL